MGCWVVQDPLTQTEGRRGTCLGVKVQSSVLRGAQESLNSGAVFQNQVALEARGGEGVLVRGEKGSKGVLTSRCPDREKKRWPSREAQKVSRNWEGPVP